MHHPRVIRKSDLWSASGVLWRSFLMGAVVFICLRGGLMIVDAYDAKLPAFFRQTPIRYTLTGIIGVGTPGYLLWRLQHKVRTKERAVLFGVGFGMGLSLCASAYSLSKTDATLFGLLPGVFIGCVVFVILSVVQMFVFTKFHQPAAIQDGALCPNCAYCLTGIESQTCPECGKSISSDQLKP